MSEKTVDKIIAVIEIETPHAPQDQNEAIAYFSAFDAIINQTLASPIVKAVFGITRTTTAMGYRDCMHDYLARIDEAKAAQDATRKNAQSPTTPPVTSSSADSDTFARACGISTQEAN